MAWSAGACNPLRDAETDGAGVAICGLIFTSIGAGLSYQFAERQQGG